MKGARKSEGGECRGSVSARVPGKRRRSRCVPEKERERESAASRENDSRRTNEKGSTMTAKRAHPPRRFDLSVLESLKRRLSFGRDVRITNIYIYIFRLRLRTVCTRGAGGASIHPFEHEHTRRRTLRVVSRIVEPSSSEGNARNQHTKQAG